MWFSFFSRRLLVPLIAAWAAIGAGCGGEKAAGDAGPYGEVERQDLIRLERQAERVGVDFFGELRRSQDGDEVALARIFAHSLSFSRLDANAATYGHVLHSSLLPWGQQYGLEGLARQLAAQPAPVRQRVRDFWFYEATQASDRVEAEARVRASAPQLFPEDYVFGAGDSLFRRR